jgi:exodeoxyribonuclease VII large subunit
LEDEKGRLDRLAMEASMRVRDTLGNKKSELLRLTWKLGQESRLAMQDSENRLGKKLQKVGFLVHHYIFTRKQKIARAQYLLDVSIPRSIASKEQHLQEYLEKCGRLSQKLLEKEKHRMEIAAQKGEMSDPGNILKRGYTITTSRGRLVKELSLLNKDELIKTQFFMGSILSQVVEIHKPDKNDN